MNNESIINRVLSCLAYLSVLFLPVLFPLIVWIVDRQDQFVARHARAAFWSQLFPALYVLVALLMFTILGAAGVEQIRNAGGWIFGILTILALLIALILYIYNIAMGISVLIKRQ